MTTLLCDGAQLPAPSCSPPASRPLTALCSLLTPSSLRALCFWTAFCPPTALFVTTFRHLTTPCSWSPPAPDDPLFHGCIQLLDCPLLRGRTRLPDYPCAPTALPPASWPHAALRAHPVPHHGQLPQPNHAAHFDFALLPIRPQSLTTPCAMSTSCSLTHSVQQSASFAHSVPSWC